MEQVTMSSKGQVAIPKSIRTRLNLAEGTKLTVHIRGQEIVLSREPAWRKLAGAGAGRNLMAAFARDRRQEREHEDSRS
jgi:AbrB family looped-hinge helix DNA binding protein